MMKLPRKALVSLALASGVLAPIANPALAADLHPPHVGTIGIGTCVWHFVNNKTGGAGPGVLTADYDIGTCITGPRLPVNRNTQHFFCSTGDATLLGASTNLAGDLLLSELTCTGKPPVCVPDKGGEVCDGRDNDCDGLVDEGLICK